MHSIKRVLKYFSLLILALLVFYAVARLTVVYRDSQLNGERTPYIQQTTSSSVIIHWQSLDQTLGTVQITDSAGELLKVTEAVATRLHAVKIAPLQADTVYHYSVSDDHGKRYADNEWFRTAPAPGQTRPTRIWVMGDSGDAGPKLDHVRDAMLHWTQQHPRTNYPAIDVWISLGDLAYTSGSDNQFQKSLFDTFPNLLKTTALWPVYGNHDSRRWTYFRIFDLPEHGEAGGEPSGTESYYSFNYSNLHFVMLDSESSSTKPGSDMYQWLQRDLKKNSSAWLVAVFHHPPYSKGTHDSDVNRGSSASMVAMRENILPLLEAAGVDLVLAGHSHMYERSYLLDCHYGLSSTFSRRNIVSDGTQHRNAEYLKPLSNTPHAGAVYVVAGSASKVDHGPINHPAMPVSMLEAGSLVIDIDKNQLTTRFINNKGEVKDTFSITRQAGYQPAYQGCGGEQEVKAATNHLRWMSGAFPI